MKKPLKRNEREDLFKAEMKLSRVHSHICNRLDSATPDDEIEGLRVAMVIVGTLYRLAHCEQGTK